VSNYLENISQAVAQMLFSKFLHFRNISMHLVVQNLITHAMLLFAAAKPFLWIFVVISPYGMLTS
jgi:hypothetical protein